MTAKKKTGRRPPVDEDKRMRADGYLTPAELAQELDVARTTVYGWAVKWKRRPPFHGVKPVIVTGDNGAVWVLAAYARVTARAA